MTALRRRLTAPVAVAIVFASSGAVARGETHSIVVWGEGADADDLASRVASHLSAPYQMRDAGTFHKALSSGRAPTLAAAAKDRGADAKLVAHARAAALATHADAAILLQARRSKRGTVVHVWLVDASGEGTAEVDHEVALGAGASVDEEADAAWHVVAADLSSPGAQEHVAAAPAPEPSESAPEASATPTSATAPDADRGTLSSDSTTEPRDATATAIASVRAAIETGAREFSYVDRLTSTLRPYTLLAAPLAAVDAEIYPLARTGTPILKDFGATFDYAMAFGLSSADSTGTAVSTTWNSFDVGARERIPIGRAVVLGMHGGYGEITYSFGGTLDTTAELPSVQYRFVRGGVDARVVTSAVSLYAYGSYLGVLSTGLVGSYFSRATVGGVEGRIGASRAIGHGFEVSLELAYTRFFYTLNPQPGDAYVAGGALDQMACGSLGVAYVF